MPLPKRALSFGWVEGAGPHRTGMTGAGWGVGQPQLPRHPHDPHPSVPPPPSSPGRHPRGLRGCPRAAPLRPCPGGAGRRIPHPEDTPGGTRTRAATTTTTPSLSPTQPDVQVSQPLTVSCTAASPSAVVPPPNFRNTPPRPPRTVSVARLCLRPRPPSSPSPRGAAGAAQCFVVRADCLRNGCGSCPADPPPPPCALWPALPSPPRPPL